MVEYIERKVAIEKTEAFCDVFATKWTDEKVLAWIKNLPSADVVEVRHEACDYCQKFDDPCGVPMIANEEDECDRGIYLYNGYLCANGGSFCDAKVKFCPMCGRRLDGE